jgi:hypothetical protein
MLVPAVIGIGLLLVWWKSSPDKLYGVLTPTRKHIFDEAMQNEKDPDKLRAIAASFAKEGLPGQATLLKKRAGLRELPEATKQARRSAFKQAMASKNAAAVEDMAMAFENEGAIAAAKALRDYALGLREAAKVPVVTTPAPSPAPEPAPAETVHPAEVVKT